MNQKTCAIKGCQNHCNGKLCDTHLNQMRRQEEPAKTVMDGKGPRGY